MKAGGGGKAEEHDLRGAKGTPLISTTTTFQVYDN
jgi:hypothetical protein